MSVSVGYEALRATMMMKYINEEATGSLHQWKHRWSVSNYCWSLIGFLLSPSPFNIYLERFKPEALENKSPLMNLRIIDEVHGLTGNEQKRKDLKQCLNQPSIK